MRKTLIASSVAVLALAGLAGGAVYAVDSEVTTESSIVVETITSEASPPGELDPDTVTAVFALFDLDQSAVDCLVGEAETVAPTDDATAEGIFITCGVGPLQILEAIVALDAAAGDVDTAVDTPAVSLAPPESVTSSGNALVDLLLGQLAAQGIIDAEQHQCLLDNLDPDDPLASPEALEVCDVSITDIITGG